MADMGVRFLARDLVRAFVENNATGFVEWPLTNGAYDHLPFMDNILPSLSTQPWSGHYEIGTHVWAFAHHTQFAHPGYLYDRAASRILAHGGSVVTRRSPDGKHFASVIETVPCDDMPVGPSDDIRYQHDFRCPNRTDAAQWVSLKVPAGITKVAVWVSNTTSDTDHAAWFLRQADLQAADGVVSLSVAPCRLVTVTSHLDKGVKGSYPAPPAATKFPLPFAVNWSHPSAKYHSVPRFLLDQRGVFEVTQTESHGLALRQATPESEVVWIPGPTNPITIVGDWDWTSYRVSAAVIVPQPSASDAAPHVAIGGLVNSSGIGANGNQPDSGVFLHAGGSSWSLQHATGRVLRNGTLPAANSPWRELSLTFGAGGTIVAAVDGEAVASVADGTYPNGWAALGCGWNECLFQSMRIEALQ